MPPKAPTVVLTGVSTGIGRASLEKLLEHGIHVFGSVRKQEDADDILEEVGGLEGEFTPLVFDVTDAEAVKAAAAKVEAALEGSTLTALINNAGINVGPDPLELISIDKFRSQLEVNLVAQVVVTQAFLPLLGTDRSRKGEPGRVVFMGSIYGSYALPWQAAYCATKHALEGLTESLRLELRIFGIEVIIIRPGPVSSEIWNKSMKARKPAEKGTGDWGLYKGTQYAAAMASTRKFVLAELESPDFYSPCSAIATKVYEAVTSKRPVLRVVKTSRYLEAWLLPRWVPLRLRDRVIAKKLGLTPLPPLDSEDEAEAAEEATEEPPKSGGGWFWPLRLYGKGVAAEPEGESSKAVDTTDGEPTAEGSKTEEPANGAPKTEETKPEEPAASEEPKADTAAPEGEKPEEPKAEEGTKAEEETKTDEAKTEEPKPEAAKAEEAKPEEAKKA